MYAIDRQRAANCASEHRTAETAAEALLIARDLLGRAQGHRDEEFRSPTGAVYEIKDYHVQDALPERDWKRTITLAENGRTVIIRRTPVPAEDALLRRRAELASTIEWTYMTAPDMDPLAARVLKEEAIALRAGPRHDRERLEELIAEARRVLREWAGVEA